MNYEIIFINDASQDNSSAVINEIVKNDSNMKLINFNKNFGQHNAILCGIREARFNKIITLDDDLQNPPEEIPNLLQKLNKDMMLFTPIQEMKSKVSEILPLFLPKLY